MDYHYLLKVLSRSNIPLFHGLSIAEIKEFISHCEARTIKRGEVVIQHGEHNTSLYIILGGVFKALNGKKRKLMRMGSGDCMGIQSLVLDVAYNVELKCIEDGVLLQFERANIIKIPDLELKLYKNICRIFAKRIININDSLSDVFYFNKKNTLGIFDMKSKTPKYKFIGYSVPCKEAHPVFKND
jgi:CRP-like cAMP-binding protein